MNEGVDEIAFTRKLIPALCRIPHVRVWRQNTGTVPVRNERGHLLRYFDAGPPTGAADISGLYLATGQRIEIELKMPRKKRTTEQVTWAQVIGAAPTLYLFFTFDAARDLAQNCAAAREAFERLLPVPEQVEALRTHYGLPPL